MRTLNLGLKKAIGMPFTYKQRFQEFLLELKASTTITSNLTLEQTTALDKYVTNFILCTPVMGFSSKLFAYQALEIATQGLLTVGSSVQADEKEKLSSALLSVLKYVGIEGESDYHFQVEAFKLAEILSTITGEVVEEVNASPLGAIAKFVVFDGGSGYDDGGTTLSDYQVGLESSETDSSVAGLGLVDIVDGMVLEQEYTISGGSGSGFYVGQIILLVDDGGGTLTFDNVALAEVVEVA